MRDKPAWVQQLAPLDPVELDRDRRLQWDASRSVDDALRADRRGADDGGGQATGPSWCS